MLNVRSKRFMTCFVVAGLLLVGMMSITLFAAPGTARAAEIVNSGPSIAGEVPCAPVSKTALGIKDSNNRWHCFVGAGNYDFPPYNVTEVCAGSYHVTIYYTFDSTPAKQSLNPGACYNFDPNRMSISRIHAQ